MPAADPFVSHVFRFGHHGLPAFFFFGWGPPGSLSLFSLLDGSADSIGSVESVKAASDIYAPVSGVVEEVNETLADQPGLINKSAEEKGWLIKVRLANPSEVSNLLAKETYETLVQEESDA